jgi:hypothetical protein
MRRDLPPTEFLVAGDHAPPFILEKRRQMFSQTVVPYLRLIPRQSAGRKPRA